MRRRIRHGMKYLYRRRIMLVILIISSLLSVRLLSGCGEGLSILTDDNNPITGIDWSEWSYRRSITITNSGAAQTGYQVNINLTSANFTFTHADTNGNDIRFNYNGSSIPYWIENWNSGAETASVWVKVPVISNPNTVLYLYYGNTGETAASNFDNTFTKNSEFSGLVAQWHIDEGSGSSIDDSSSNSNDGTITGASWVGADGGRWYTSTTAGFSTGDSLSFDGTDDYISVADSSSLDVSSITIAAWIKTGSDVTSTQYIVSKWNEGTNQRSYAVLIENLSVYFLTSQFGTLATVDSQGRATLLTNTWYHVAVTSDGSVKKIFINGELSGTSWAWAYSIHAGTAVFNIGAKDSTPVEPYTGIIDEVSVYNTALSANEIRALSRRSKYSSTVGTSAVGSEENVP